MLKSFIYRLLWCPTQPPHVANFCTYSAGISLVSSPDPPHPPSIHLPQLTRSSLGPTSSALCLVVTPTCSANNFYTSTRTHHAWRDKQAPPIPHPTSLPIQILYIILGQTRWVCLSSPPLPLPHRPYVTSVPYTMPRPNLATCLPSKQYLSLYKDMYCLYPTDSPLPYDISRLCTQSNILPFSRLGQRNTPCISAQFLLSTWLHFTHAIYKFCSQITCTCYFLPQHAPSLSHLELIKEVHMLTSHVKNTNSMNDHTSIFFPKHASPIEMFANENPLHGSQHKKLKRTTINSIKKQGVLRKHKETTQWNQEERI